MSNLFLDTVKSMRERAQKSDKCLVAYSGGKDSLVVLDLAVKTFSTVIPFNIFTTPNLRCVREQMEYAEKRWNVRVIYYPSSGIVEDLRDSYFLFSHTRNESLPSKLAMEDMYCLARRDTGIDLVINGMREAESQARKRIMRRTHTYYQTFHPLAKWTRWDVLAYLKTHDIPLPQGARADMNGTSTNYDSTLWMHDTYPDDYLKMCAWYPLVRAWVYRRHFYGIGEYYNGKTAADPLTESEDFDEFWRTHVDPAATNNASAKTTDFGDL